MNKVKCSNSQSLVYISEQIGHCSGSIHSYTHACSLELKHDNFSVIVELVPIWPVMSSFWRRSPGMLDCPRPYFSFSSCKICLVYNTSSTLYSTCVYAEQHLCMCI